MMEQVEKGKEVGQVNKTLKEMLADVSVQKRFEDMLGKKAQAFMSSIISVSQGNEMLQKADPMSIIASAAIAASLDLPITPSLGQACIVPYNINKKLANGQWEKKTVAQFQIMSRGFVQLGLRSKEYKAMNATEVYEGEIIGRNRLTGDLDLDPKGKKSDKVVGYLFYFRLLNGFEKYTYMTVEECKAHGKKYSKSFDNENGKWKQDFPAMCLKTVVKMGLSKWGPLSSDMQKGVELDQAAITPDGKPEYIDSTAEKTDKVDAEMPKRASKVKEEDQAPETGGEAQPLSSRGTVKAVVRSKDAAAPGGYMYRVSLSDGKDYLTPVEEVAKALKAYEKDETEVVIEYAEMIGARELLSFSVPKTQEVKG